MTATAAKQIKEATTLGTAAFTNGLKRVPWNDKELTKIFGARNIGQTPKGEATTQAITKAWLAAWDQANLAKEF